MKIHLFIMAAMAACLSVSCSKELHLDPSSKEGARELLASMPNQPKGTRVEIQGMSNGLSKVFWSKNDAFLAFDENHKASCYRLEGEGNGPTGRFLCNEPQSGLPVRAAFPASANQQNSPFIADNKLNIVLPDIYRVSDNSQNAPMFGEIDNGKVTFQYLCSMLKIDLSHYKGIYSAVRLTSADRVLSGNFSYDVTRVLDATNPGIMSTAVPSAANTSVCVEKKGEEQMLYLPIPAGKYGQLCVEVLDAADKSVLTAEFTDKEVCRGYLYTIALKDGGLLPFTERVNVQTEIAREEQIIDNSWVAIGVNRDYSLQLDYTDQYKGKPSYRFELKEEDNNLEGYGGDSKGRVEMSYCYATAEDYKNYSAEELYKQQVVKTVYHAGKGSCKQGSKMKYSFSVKIPDDISPAVHTIFAQWHGMPSRTLVQTPEGLIKTISIDEFVELDKRMVFKKEKGYDKIFDQYGNYTVSKKPNGWKVEQGGYPPMAFGITDGYFYIQANSDMKWMSDKDERCNINPASSNIMDVNYSKEGFKSSTLAYKLPMELFPKDTWVSFDIDVDWSEYVRERDEIKKPGKLNVYMRYSSAQGMVNEHIVDHQTMNIGRNDDYGYYFKFGIYRTSGNVIPLHYRLAGFSEEERTY